jgi:hypothetical protein
MQLRFSAELVAEPAEPAVEPRTERPAAAE